jgi:hypothetical protein
MTATRKVSRSRKRPARTPPSTFLFLPIHLSNNPGRSPVPGKRRSRRSPAHPTWPYDHGRMLDHRESSEGLVDAPSRQAAARQEVLYSLRPAVLSTVQVGKYGLWTSRGGTLENPAGTFAMQPGEGETSAFSRRDLSGYAPHLSHIPPPFLHIRVGDAAIRGGCQL